MACSEHRQVDDGLTLAYESRLCHMDDYLAVSDPDGGRVSVGYSRSDVDQRQSDPPTEHRREVATRHLADRGTRRFDGIGLPGWPTAVGYQSLQPALRTLAPLQLEGRLAPETVLLPTHHPAEPALKRSDPGAELVAVQRKPGFEAQG